jgi:hypothetical protein
MYDNELWDLAIDHAMNKIAKEFDAEQLLTESGYHSMTDQEKHRFRSAQVPYFVGMGALGGGLGTALSRKKSRNIGGIKVKRRLAGGKAIAVPAMALAGGTIAGALGLGLEGYAARRARKSKNKKR